MKTIQIVRHGQSQANAGIASADPALIPLTDKGVQQANALAALLDTRASKVITSHYERAKDTAQPYCDRWQITPEREPLLYEFVTLSPSAVKDLDMAARLPLVDAFWARGDVNHRHGEDSESFADLAQRVSTVRASLDRLDDGTVLFGHGRWFALLLWQLQGYSCEDGHAMQAFRRWQLAMPMPNCAVYHLRSSVPGEWSIRFDEGVYRHLHLSDSETPVLA